MLLTSENVTPALFNVAKAAHGSDSFLVKLSNGEQSDTLAVRSAPPSVRQRVSTTVIRA
jgi:hypothetical protein